MRYIIVINVVIMEVKMIDINLLLKKALQETENIQIGEAFLLKDLFIGYEWNRIPHKYRLMLGNLFLDYVKTEHKCIIAMSKNASRQQIYKKIIKKGAPFES